MAEYPDKLALRMIQQWPSDWFALLAYVRGLWWAPEWGWRQETRRQSDDTGEQASIQYWVSTGGWRGNEDLIAAMRYNQAFWCACWVSVRRGGHYEFEVRERGSAADRGGDQPPASGGGAAG